MESLEKRLDAACEDWAKACRGNLPEALFVLGSGFKSFVNAVQKPSAVPIATLRNVPRPKVEGHGDTVVFGQVAGRNVAVVAGRVHLYEGYSPHEVVFLVRLAARAGVKRFILTNAAGSLSPKYPPGEIVAIRDHINFTGQSCLMDQGRAFGALFVDMVNAYDAAWRESVQAVVKLKEGVYLGAFGPAYETPAEAKMFAGYGADMVGMSTVLETMAARQMDCQVLGFSFITNISGGGGGGLDHSHVLHIAEHNAGKIAKVLTAAVEHM
jgi:purine-nucleoside phosphorylase